MNVSPQGATDADIASTRTARSIVFLIVTLLYGVTLLFNNQVSGFVQYLGVPIAVVTAVIGAMSVTKVHITNPFRVTALVVLAVMLSYMLVWNFGQGRLQAATLLFYLFGTCWIEVALALIIRDRERRNASDLRSMPRVR